MGTPFATPPEEAMGMRFAAAGTAALLASVALSGSARAGATVDRLFTAVNGAPIAPTAEVRVHQAAGDLLTMALVVTSDEPLLIYAFSLEFNRTDQELELVRAGQWPGTARGFAPVADPCRSGLYPYNCRNEPTGFWGTFNSLAGMDPTNLLPPGAYEVGSTVWRTRDAKSDGADVFSGLFNTGVDAFGDGASELMDGRVLFHGATVNANPEPATAYLLGTGLLALAAVRRRASASPRPLGHRPLPARDFTAPGREGARRDRTIRTSLLPSSTGRLNASRVDVA